MNYTKLKSAIAQIHEQKQNNLTRADLYCYYFLKDFFNRYEVEKVDITMNIYQNNSGYGGSQDKLKKTYDYRMYTFDPANPEKKTLYLIQDGQTSYTHDNSYGASRKIYNAVIKKSDTKELIFAQDVFKEFSIISLIHDEMRVSMDSKNWDWKISVTKDNLDDDFLKALGQNKFDAMIAIRDKDSLESGVPLQNSNLEANEFKSVFNLKEVKEPRKNKL